MAEEVVFHHDDVVASFPYSFDLKKEGDHYIGFVRSYLYKDLKIDGKEDEIRKKLSAISCIDGCAFVLEGNCINYTTSRIFETLPDTRSAEVATRRSFIEDYIEAAGDLQSIADSCEGTFLKTEFVY